MWVRFKDSVATPMKSSVEMQSLLSPQVGGSFQTLPQVELSYIKDRTLAKISVKGQRINILSFVGSTVSKATTQLCHYRQNLNEWSWPCSSKISVASQVGYSPGPNPYHFFCLSECFSNWPAFPIKLTLFTVLEEILWHTDLSPWLLCLKKAMD